MDCRKKKIGFLHETSFHETQGKLLEGAMDAAGKENCNLIRFTMENNRDHTFYPGQLSFLAAMIEKFQLDGLMFLGWANKLNEPGFFKKLLHSCNIESVPILSVGKIFDDIPCVHVPGYLHFKEIMEHLVAAHGYKKIVYIEPVFLDDRFGAYREVMESNGLYNPDLVIKGSDLGIYNDGDFHRRGKMVVSLLQEKKLLDADAIVSMFNEEAATIIDELEKMDYSVPEDIAVTGWDDSDIGKYRMPSITSIYYPFYELAYQGCKKLIRMINNEPVEHNTPVLGKLKLRESCGCTLSSLIENSLNCPDKTINLENLKIKDYSDLQTLVKDKISCFNQAPLMLSLKEELLEEKQNVFFHYIYEILSDKKINLELLHMYWEELLIIRSFLILLYKDDPLILLKVEHLWFKVHILVKDKKELLNGKIELERNNLSLLLSKIGLKIITTFDLLQIYNILSKHLEETGIKSCYIFLYKDQVVSQNDQILDYFYTGGGKPGTIEIGEKIDNSQLAEGFLFEDGPHTYVLDILHVKDRLLGFVLFEPGPRDERYYNGLSIQLSSSIMGSLTLYDLECANGELTENTERIRGLNEQLKDENLRISAEMELAKRIQTGLLPDITEHEVYDIAATMIPAAEVGGDYYDVIHVGDIDWIIMGDVSGHGVSAGLVMMMVQTSIHVILNQQPDLPPDELLTIINKTITHNIRKLHEEKFVTIIVLACYQGNRFYHAGSHLPLMLYRHKTETVELIYTEGMWIGFMEDIAGINKNSNFELGEDDCLLLYTDGVIEARLKEDRSVFYGVETLKEQLIKSCRKSSAEIVETIISSLAWYNTNDDVSVLVLKKR